MKYATPTLACILLTLGALAATWALDPWLWRWLIRRESARLVVEQAEQLVNDDRDRAAWQSLTARLQKEPRP